MLCPPNVIIEWRVRLGTYDPGVDGPWRVAVWRYNWREVRDAVIDINVKEYPVHNYYEELKERKEDYTADEVPEAGVLALARGLVEARELRPLEGETAAHRVDRAASEIYRLSATSWRQHIVDRSDREIIFRDPSKW